ncbi:MAG: hypothetical protein FJ247_04430 [Nitrospira sp.]|nr:hypothetical protein [Nitrospira sp.]
MNLRTILSLVVAVAVSGMAGPVLAYDASPGSSSSDPCNQVIFSAYTPAPFSMDHNNKEVPPKSDFSFLASKATSSQSIKVIIKGQSVPLTVTAVSNGYLVKGKLPDTVKGTYIRVEIFANGPNQCDRADGWLLKVAN